MKKLFVSVGLVAVGTSAVCAAGGAGAMGMGDNSKNWSVSATLRGFYDDNYATSSKGIAGTNEVRDSFGVTIRPSVAYSLPLDNTSLGFRYTFGATWYEDRSKVNSQNDPWDMSHEFAGFFNHNFSDKTSLDVMNSFVISQEPELLQSGPLTVPYRTEGDNIRNHGEITFNGTLTKQLKYTLGYQNTFFDYENSGGFVIPTVPAATVQSSLSGVLDRMEHMGLVNLNWQAAPKTVAVLGYNIGEVNYSSDETIANLSTTNNVLVSSKFRDNRSHYLYAGVNQNFTKDLLLSARVGAQRIQYVNDLSTPDATTPYISLNLNYAYRPNSTLTLGLTHSRNQTDVISPDANGRITQDQQTSVVYANLNHRFTPKLSGNISGQWQSSEFNGGLHDSKNDTYVDIGGNLRYRFNQHLTGEVGYTFSQLTSDIAGRDYDRNRIYLGLTATY